MLSERLDSEGITSVLIGALQLEVDVESRDVLFAWGYFPNVRGKVAEFSSGWVAIRLKDSDDADFVQIASGLVLGIDTGNLVSVWIGPVFQGDRR
ncbi:putative glycosyltransferase [Streptomyces lydicamycinicus]|uniref:Putative glycosyltransferase n=1 Tax=Streptomyces lydicamycinicus TaxID=1546107 RepID=A0A0P4R5X9_9ACTN|nr:putative glycosyltransferase [Streptomyces lydicamycinicus]